MSSKSQQKAELLQALAFGIRRMSAQSVLISSAVAERVGLSSSDLECLDIIVMGHGGTTPGALSAATGMTSGAITGLIDRLERAGFVRREASPGDRRKVLVVANEERLRSVGAYYERLQASTTSLWSGYTVAELHIVNGFMNRSIDLAARELEYIRTLPPLQGQ